MYNVQAQLSVISYYQLQLHARISAASAVFSQPRPASGLWDTSISICYMHMHIHHVYTYTYTQIAACRIYFLYAYTHRSIIDILRPPAVFLLYWVLARVKHGHSGVSGAVYQHQLTGTDAFIYCIYCILDHTKNKSTQSASLLIFQWPCVTHKVLPPGLTPFLW